MESELESQSLKNSQNDSGVATFVLKLYDILRDPKNAQVIAWQPDGKSFSINNLQLLSERVLLHYFRHQNYQSFIRQLNMYNFSKVKTNKFHRFTHPHFVRGQDVMLKLVKRRPEKKKKKENSSQQIQSENQPSQQATTPKLEKVQKANKCQKYPSSQKTKRVCFNVTNIQKDIQDENLTTLMAPSLKWVQANKEDNCWSRIRSYKSLDCSLKLIDSGSQQGSQRIIMEEGKIHATGELFSREDLGCLPI